MVLLYGVGIGLTKKWNPISIIQGVLKPKPEGCISRLDVAAMEASTSISKEDKARDWTLTTTLYTPQSEDELQRMNGFAILAFGLFSKSQELLPEITDATLVPEESSKIQKLPKIIPYSPVITSDSYSKIDQNLGRYRREYFLFIPYESLRIKGRIQADLKNPEASVRALTLPLKEFRALTEDEKNLIDLDIPPHPDTVARILNDEFCFARPRVIPAAD